MAVDWRVDKHSHKVQGPDVPSSYSVTCHRWPREGLELTDEMRAEARKMLAIAVELGADYVAFEDDGRSKIILEIDGEVNWKVEERMRFPGKAKKAVA